MKWLQLFLSLLPVAIKHAQTVGTDLQGHQKKAAVIDILNGVAEGVAQASPENGAAATAAAAIASNTIDQVVTIMKATGAISSTPAPK